MDKIKKLVIIGAGEFGQIAYEYFMDDSHYEVVAFAVEREYRNQDELFGLPIIDFEEICVKYPSDQYVVFIAVTYVKFNRARKKLVNLCKSMGYTCATYVSSKSFIGRGVKLGENVFVFENNAIAHGSIIGDNVIIWGGGNISHSCIVEEDSWLANGVVLAGFSRIGGSSFIGSHATIGDNVTVAKDTLIGAGAVVYKDINESGGMYVGVPARRLEKSSFTYFGI